MAESSGIVGGGAWGPVLHVAKVTLHTIFVDNIE